MPRLCRGILTFRACESLAKDEIVRQLPNNIGVRIGVLNQEDDAKLLESITIVPWRQPSTHLLVLPRTSLPHRSIIYPLFSCTYVNLSFTGARRRPFAARIFCGYNCGYRSHILWVREQMHSSEIWGMGSRLRRSRTKNRRTSHIHSERFARHAPPGKIRT